MFVQSKVAVEELARHYEQDSDPAYEGDNLDCLNYYYGHLAKLIRQRHPQTGRLLDVGCSAGWFLDAMQGWECYGNEIAGLYGEAARQRYGDRVFLGAFEEYPLRPEFFDVITLQDVFDHMPDPIASLAKCRYMLKPNGLIVIKVHNISCLYARISVRYFYAIAPPSHLFYYNEETLTRILRKSGFQIIDSRFMAHVLKVRTAMIRLGQGDPKSRRYSVCRALAKSPLANFKIKKNLHDVITVMATRQ